MRINTPPPPVFTVPDSGAVQEVVTLRSVRPIGEEPGERGRSAPPAPPPEPQPEAAPVEGPAEERRASDDTRRMEDRRKRQIPVLIDTRSGRDRRRSARRDSDPPPAGPSIDLKA